MENLFCTLKFDEIHLDLEQRQLYNCCKALPERLNIKEIEKDPTKMLVSDQMIEDRKKMLHNQMFKSCHHGCYKYEEDGKISRRTSSEIYLKNIKNKPVDVIPKTVTLQISSDCNLACAYCSGDFSSKWRRELKRHGPIGINKMSNFNMMQDKLKQKARTQNNKLYNTLQQALSNKGVEEIAITGGEPLLNAETFDLLNKYAKDKPFHITTGLKISEQRLQKLLDAPYKENITINVSAETTEEHFEFIRYGMQWKKWVETVERIKASGINIIFLSTINNLSLFKFKEFVDKYPTHTITQNLLTWPFYLQSHILDNDSKEIITKQFDNDKRYTNIIKNLSKEPSNLERLRCSDYLKQLANVRNLNLNIFPKSFLNWLEINCL